ncbi:hypothetical protein AUTU_08060 [Aureibacter tunicatorum]|nr:hypothetical protein AUTU_08060 [Aureibacter tunicatorum]
MPQINFDNGKLHYESYSSGDKTLICFHGFGQTHTIFSNFEKKFPNHRIIAIDLPYHGKSHCFSNKCLKSYKGIEAFKTLFEKEKIKDFEALGFSIGAIPALYIFEHFQESCDKITLIAPEGIKKNFFFRLATTSKLGETIFKTVMHNPSIVTLPIKALRTVKMITNSTAKFVLQEVKDQAHRNKVFNTWICLSSLNPNLPYISKALETNVAKSMEIFLGEHDHIINPVAYEKSIRKKIPTAKINIIRGSHFNIVNSFLNQK